MIYAINIGLLLNSLIAESAEKYTRRTREKKWCVRFSENTLFNSSLRSPRAVTRRTPRYAFVCRRRRPTETCGALILNLMLIFSPDAILPSAFVKDFRSIFRATPAYAVLHGSALLSPQSGDQHQCILRKKEYLLIPLPAPSGRQ